jgi:excinuclease ABC subunit A
VAERLIVRGAREHNLKDVSLDLPRNSLIVFTGLSGSGKSSLAFDTIFAEGQRRYVESLSAYARQFLGQMDKPDVDFIDGLSPAVSIDQKAAGRNPRSTVGTITEVYDYLRLLYARVGKPHCPICGRPIARQSPQQIVDRVLELPEGTRFQVLAPVVRGRKGEYGELLRELQAKGYSRARVDGAVIRLDGSDDGGLPKLKKYERHTIEVVVDRLDVKASSRRRLTDSVETSLGLSGGVVVFDFVDLADDDPHRERMFSEHLACLYDDLSFEELEPRSFSFNSPWGACPACTGLGTKMEVDPELVVGDPDKTLAEGAISPWSGGSVSDYFIRLVEALGNAMGFTVGTRWSRLPAAAKNALLHGYDEQVHVRYKNRYGRERSYYTSFEGAIPYIERRHAEAESDSSRERFAGFMREVPCPVCHGARLKPISLAVTVDGRSIADPQGGQRPSRLPARRRPRLPVAGPGVGHAGRRRGAADPAGHPDRLRPGRRAVRAGRAVDRAAPAGQQPPARDPDPATRPGQHADRGGARRGDDPGRRLGGGHRPASRRARRPGSRIRAAAGPAVQRGVADWRLPDRPPADRGAREAAPAGPRPGGRGQGRGRAQPARR